MQHVTVLRTALRQANRGDGSTNAEVCAGAQRLKHRLNGFQSTNQRAIDALERPSRAPVGKMKLRNASGHGDILCCLLWLSSMPSLVHSPEALPALISTFISSVHAGQTSCTKLLVTGPPDIGKSHTLRKLSSSVNVFYILPSYLHTSHASTFPGLDRVLRDAKGTKHAVIVIDDLEIVAPARVVSGEATWGERRAVAALVGFLDELPRRVAVIGVCGQVGSIWAGLVRRGRFGDIVNIGEVTESGRREAVKDAMQGLRLNLGSEEERVTRAVAKSMRGCGFSEVGKVLVDAVVEEEADDQDVSRAVRGITQCGNAENNASISERGERLLGRRILRAAERAKPSLLQASGAYWMINPREGSIDSSGDGEENNMKDSNLIPLFGLQKELELIQGCLTAAFIRETDKSDTPAARALQKIGCPRGLLLYGPSGCGKTSVTYRIASMCPGLVRVLRTEAAEIFSSTVGFSERAIKSIFSSARAASPAVIVIENVDVIAPHRTEEAAAYSTRIVSTLLTEIDGVIEYESSVFVLCTARDTASVDPALLRPGRLDMCVRLGRFDDDQAVKELIASRARQMKCSLGDSLDRFARQMTSWTPAEIVSLCNDAGLRACREQYHTACRSLEVSVQERHFEEALRDALRSTRPP